MPRPKGPEGTWEENNKRVIFYCPKDVERRIQAVMASTNRSKTQVIVDALRAHLDEATHAQEASR